MIYNDEVKKYITGKKFSDRYKFLLKETKKDKCKNRLNLIKELVKDKKVIHVGCVDHVELVEWKIKRGYYLHKIITDSASKVIGIDINKSGIDYLNKKLGFNNAIYSDITKDTPNTIIDDNWDYMILGEILEHTDNPVLFLENIIKRYSSYIKSIIITVPNALRYQNFTTGFSNSEYINSDHRYWFTPYTLSKVIVQSGMKLGNLFLCSGHPIPAKSLLTNIIYNLFPIFRDTIISISHISK
jgi:hypothetical protein